MVGAFAFFKNKNRRIFAIINGVFAGGVQVKFTGWAPGTIPILGVLAFCTWHRIRHIGKKPVPN